MKIVSVIPARGGSKRIPRKNLASFLGKPLMVHSIEHSLSSRRVSRTIVSTDDSEIAATAQKAGAEVIKRPSELSDDAASSEAAIAHALGYLKNSENYTPDLVVFLQCTSPLRKHNDIDLAIEHLLETAADSLLSVCAFSKYIWDMKNGSARPINYDYHKRWREQDFPRQYLENGSIYVFKPWVLERENNRLGGKIALYEMDGLHSFQIDSGNDFELGAKSAELSKAL